jgi:hypothetical protein
MHDLAIAGFGAGRHVVERESATLAIRRIGLGVL